MSNDKHLQSLYPFLHKKKRDPVALNNALIDSVNQKAALHQQVIERFFSQNSQAIVDAAGAIFDVYRNNGELYCMGNGGSSSDASHIAVEFLHPVTTGRPALPAHDLTQDKTFITAVGNDVGFDHIFERQLRARLKPHDMVIGVSTSGNSTNLTKAFEYAQSIGAKTLALSGGNGGDVASMGLDHCLVVDTDSIHRIQECHVTIYHILWDLTHTLLADDRGNLHQAAKTGETP